MATVTAFTAARMQAIENSAIVGGVIDGDDLILTRFDGATINAGDVRGAVGPEGPGASAEDTPFADVPGRFSSTNVEDALQEVMLPAGTIIMGGWASDPSGFFILNGATIVGGAITYPALAAAYPSWVSVNDIILPNAIGAVPMGSASPGVVAGSMTHTLSVANLAEHRHTGPDHRHNMNHGHADNIGATQGTHMHDAVKSASNSNSGNLKFYTREGSAGSNYDWYGGSLIQWDAYSGLPTGYDSAGPITITGGVTNFTGNTDYSGTGNTGYAGTGTPVNHTPKNLSVKLAVKF